LPAPDPGFFAGALNRVRVKKPFPEPATVVV
jgi:hypothetical protein